MTPEVCLPILTGEDRPKLGSQSPNDWHTDLVREGEERERVPRWISPFDGSCCSDGQTLGIDRHAGGRSGWPASIGKLRLAQTSRATIVKHREECGSRRLVV